MTVESNLRRVRDYHNALNAVDLEAAASFFAATAEYHSPGIGTLADKPAIMAAMATHFAEYPDQHATDEAMESIGPNQVRSHWRLAATAKSTGLPYERRGRELITFDAEGLIIRVDVEDT